MWNKWTLRLPFLVLLSLGIQSCGKKAPPFLPPSEPLTARVIDLKGEWLGDDIVLKGVIREGERDAKGKAFMGLRVYYAEYPRGSLPCEGCPLKLDAYQDFGREALGDRGVECRLKGKEKDRVYYFKVHLVGDKGLMGPPSNIAKVAYPFGEE
ncbi:MAG: hypothetical protein JRJ29_17110 [Deltaproteobacteria bacterium]|nr:hypothetical protein [Deltaproteobacteria bacterium]